MTERINGKDVVGTLMVSPDHRTEWPVKILKCNCPGKPGLEVHPLDKALNFLRGLTLDQAVKSVKQHGWDYHLSYVSHG